MFLAKFLVKFLVVLYLLLVKASARVTVYMAVSYFVIENLFLKRMFISSVWFEIILKIKNTQYRNWYSSRTTYLLVRLSTSILYIFPHLSKLCINLPYILAKNDDEFAYFSTQEIAWNHLVIFMNTYFRYSNRSITASVSG